MAHCWALALLCCILVSLCGLHEFILYKDLKHLKSLQTVGYKEFFDYFEGNQTKEKAIELIKQHSRNYAKRQITWFKTHHPGTYLFGNLDENLEIILNSCK